MDISKLRQEADAGSVVAQSVLGICYLDGYDVEVNYKKALRLLTAAATRGAPRAKANLARMYVEGLGVKKTYPKECGFTRKQLLPANSLLKSNSVAFIRED
jgi:TPR repeat protein